MSHLFAGQFAEAHAAAQQALRADKAAYDALLVLAAIALEHGNAPGAAKLTALARQDGHAGAWLETLDGRIALAQQDGPSARTHAVAADASCSHNPHIANQIGVLLSRTGLHDRAVPHFEKAVGGAADNVDYRYNYAVALQFVGELSAAEMQFRELVSRDPAHAKSWLALVQLADQPEADWETLLDEQFARASDNETRLLLGHSLARLCEDRDDWDASLEWLDRAKAPKASEVRHDRAATDRLFAAAKAGTDDGRITPNPSGDRRPIFIAGLPRSGTTLVERILTSHPKVETLGELSDLGLALKRLLATPGPFVLDDALLEAAHSADDISSAGDVYLKRIENLAKGSPRFIDKMPFNIFFAPAILRALPGAQVICLRRSPFDTLFSNYRQLFATSFGYYSYAYDFGDTAHFVARFEALADTLAETLPQRRFLSVIYEDVIADQRLQSERLLDFLGLEWNESVLEFHRNAAPVATASSVQVRSPIYTKAVERWRRYEEGSKRAIAALAEYGISPAS